MEFGIDEMDPFGVGALFLGQSMAHHFGCDDAVRGLFAELIALDVPRIPTVPVASAVGPVDEVLDRIEPQPGLVELVEALLLLGVDTPPTTEVSQRLYRSVAWTMMRHDPAAATPVILRTLREATPGARHHSRTWPRHEFFAAVLVLVYLGGPEARAELEDLLAAARDLRYDDLAPVLEWYLDHHHAAPSR